MHLTKYVLKLLPGARSKPVKALWDKHNINQKWNESRWSKKWPILVDTNDYMLNNRIVAHEYNRLKKKSKAHLAKKTQKTKRRKFVAKSQRIANKFKIFAAQPAAGKKK